MYWSKLILIFSASFVFATNLDELRLDAFLNEGINAKKSSNAFAKLYKYTKYPDYLEDSIRQGYLANINVENEVKTLENIKPNSVLLQKINIVKLIEKKDYKKSIQDYYKYINKNEDLLLADAMVKELANNGKQKDALKIAKNYYKKYENEYSFYLYLEALSLAKKYKDVVKLSDELNKIVEQKNKANPEDMPFLTLRLNALKELSEYDKIYRLDPKSYIEKIQELNEKKDYKTILKYTKNIPIDKDFSLFLYFRFIALNELDIKYDEFYELGIKLFEFSDNKEFLYVLAKKFQEKNKKNYLLKLCNFDEDLSISIYMYLKKYKKLSEVLLNKAIKTQNNGLLIESYLFEMLDNPKKFDYFKLDELLAKGGFNDNMLNTYAYTLIDEKIDIKKGIKLAKKALEKNPENIYYLDTLAWGYYLDNDCKNAKEIMQKISASKKELEQEIKEHLKRINKCKN